MSNLIGNPPVIDSARLWQALMDLARIGATARGGVRRLALTDEDRQARDLFVQWCRSAGCSISIDAVGNIFARRPGHNDALPAIMAGSHLDTQPSGGKFDGAYGVMAGLEVVRALNDVGVQTEAPIEIVAWTNEEGTRFAPSMMGSLTYAGLAPLAQTYASTDSEGKSMLAELERIGYKGEGCGGRAIAAYFEAHIEQGPVLEEEGKTIGVVLGGQGQFWYDVVLVGQDAHAGTTPMRRRHDALVGAASVVQAVNRIGRDTLRSCATVGHMRVEPNSRNVVPGRVSFTIEVRHPDDEQRLAMDAAVRRAVQEAAHANGLEVELQRILDQPATPFDADCVFAVRRAAEQRGFSHMDIVSGAAHDAIAMARIVPTAMIFVPCAGGVSHNEAESASPGDLAAGCQVLLDAIVRKAAG